MEQNTLTEAQASALPSAGQFQTPLLAKLDCEMFNGVPQPVRVMTVHPGGMLFQGNVLIASLDVDVYTQDETEDNKVTVFDSETMFNCTIPAGGTLVIEAYESDSQPGACSCEPAPA